MQIWFAALANFCKGLLIAEELLVSFLCVVIIMIVSGLLNLQEEVPMSVFARMLALGVSRSVFCGDVSLTQCIMLLLWFFVGLVALESEM